MKISCKILFIILIFNCLFVILIISSNPDDIMMERKFFVCNKVIECLNNKVKPDTVRFESYFSVIVCWKEFNFLLKDLLEYGANPNLAGTNGSVLCSAIVEKCLKNVELLLKYGANPNLRNTGFFKQLPLEVAINARNIKKTDVKIIKQLLAYGADPNEIDKYGNTMLINILKMDDNDFKESLVSILLYYNANPLLLNNNGENAIGIAYKNRLNNLVDLMLGYIFKHYGLR